MANIFNHMSGDHTMCDLTETGYCSEERQKKLKKIDIDKDLK